MEAHSKTNERMQDGRVGVYQNMPKLTWADWLRKEALAGNGEALRALRSREEKLSAGEHPLARYTSCSQDLPRNIETASRKKGDTNPDLWAYCREDSGQNIHISRGEQDQSRPTSNADYGETAVWHSPDREGVTRV